MEQYVYALSNNIVGIGEKKHTDSVLMVFYLKRLHTEFFIVILIFVSLIKLLL